ncbi:ATP-binding protein [Candidatus Poribacteria bacterium]|nr:ATP-binding protein [Candidatus Poribacteria bacterium]
MLRNIVGPPARRDDFFDREETVELLWERLASGNVLLAAPRRFGKTSLMYRLIDEPRDGWTDFPRSHALRGNAATTLCVSQFP